MKIQSIPSLLVLLPSLALCAAEADTQVPAADSTPAASPEVQRERISNRIMEAYKQEPNRQMMVPKTGDRAITDLRPVSTPTPAPDNSDSAKQRAAEKEKVVNMPAMNVVGRKETEATWEAKKQIYEIDKKIAAEKERTVATDADKLLNSKAISVMGEADAKARENDAKRRIHELEVKESVAACATDPTNDEENKKLLKMLQDLEYQKKQH